MPHLGHYGVEKMLLKAQEAVYRPGITNDIKTNKATSEICAIHKKPQQNETLQLHEVPMSSLEKLAAALFQLNRVHYLLVVDCYSRFPVLTALHTLTAINIIKHVKEISQNIEFSKLISDGSPQFDCQELRRFIKLWCFTYTLSSMRYHC